MSDPRNRRTPIVVVTGPPASGKSTLSETIANKLELPLIAKDSIKETLFDAFGTKDREWSQWLGQATYPLIQLFLETQLRARKPVVIEATFGQEIANGQFRELGERLPFNALQLYCNAPSDVLFARYASRADERHPGHVDDQILHEIRRDLEAGRWQPLALGGETVVVDTSDFDEVDVDALILKAAQHVSGRRSGPVVK